MSKRREDFEQEKRIKNAQRLVQIAEKQAKATAQADILAMKQKKQGQLWDVLDEGNTEKKNEENDV